MTITAIRDSLEILHASMECAAGLLFAWWLYRLWKKTGDPAYKWLLWGMGVLPCVFAVAWLECLLFNTNPYIDSWLHPEPIQLLPGIRSVSVTGQRETPLAMLLQQFGLPLIAYLLMLVGVYQLKEGKLPHRP